MKLNLRLTAAVLPALALGACSLAPRYVQPVAPVAPSWPAGNAYLAQSEATLPVVSYRDVFRDPRLQALIEQALANNRDLRVAAANVAAARAQVRVTRANQFPAVGFPLRPAKARQEAGSVETARTFRCRAASRPSNWICSANLRMPRKPTGT
ncbi:TolC family protein [Novosphingobium panipatense]